MTRSVSDTLPSSSTVSLSVVMGRESGNLDRESYIASSTSVADMVHSSQVATPERNGGLSPPVLIPFEWSGGRISGQVIAAEPIGPSIAVGDLVEGSVRLYSPDSHSISGALDELVLTTTGDAIATTFEAVFFVPGADFSQDPVILEPSERLEPYDGSPPPFYDNMDVISDRSGTFVWMVQTRSDKTETLVDIVDIDLAIPEVTVRLDGEFWPVGVLSDSLVLSDPSGLLVIWPDGTTKPVLSDPDILAIGKDRLTNRIRVIAAYDSYIACLSGDSTRLVIVDITNNDINTVTVATPGIWIPFRFPATLGRQPRPVTRSDAVLLGFFPKNSLSQPYREREWTLYEITLSGQEVRHLANGEARLPKGLGIGGGDYVLVFNKWRGQLRIEILDSRTPGSLDLLSVLPEGYFIYDAQ